MSQTRFFTTSEEERWTFTERLNVITANDDDNRILECALAARAEFLVTGDKRHPLPLGSIRGTKIVSPAQLLDLLSTTAR